MKISRRRLLLSLPLVAAACKETPRPGMITAGPFRVQCPPKWAEGAVVEKVAARPLYSQTQWEDYQKNSMYVRKASYFNRPEHWAIRLPKLAGDYPSAMDPGEDSSAPQILIHRSVGWASVMQDGKAEAETAKETVAKLRAGLDRMEKEKSAVSSPAFMDDTLTFLTLKKPLSFKRGRGVRMVGEWTIESSLVGNLHYLFIGMSDDDTCQIIATFPLSLPGLPAGPDMKAEHFGFSTSRYGELTTRFGEYEKKVQDWLEADAAKIQPQIKDLDAMIESLEVETWK